MITVISGSEPPLIISPTRKSARVKKRLESRAGAKPPSPLYFAVANAEIAPPIRNAARDVIPSLDVGFSSPDDIIAQIKAHAKNIAVERIIPKSNALALVLCAVCLEFFIKKASE